MARFKVEIPAFAAAAGKRMVLPAFFFPTLQKNMFTSQMRKYPIVFPYPFTEDDEISLKLPEGYVVEEPPYRRKAGLSYAGYEINTVLQDRLLVTKRKMRLDGLQFPPDKYEELKNFFSVVQKGDGGQAVLRQQGEEKAQSQNGRIDELLSPSHPCSCGKAPKLMIYSGAQTTPDGLILSKDIQW